MGTRKSGTKPPCSDDLLAWLSDAVPDPMAIIDAGDDFRLVNTAWAALFGYRQAELVGTRITALLGEGPLVSGMPFPLSSEGRPQRDQAEMIGRRKDGAWLPIDVSAMRHDASSGGMRVLVARDMSARWAAEDLSQFAQEQDRKRIADEIHDGSIQSITAASLRLQQLRRGVREAAELQILTTIEELLAMTSVGLRDLMVKLHPPALDGLGLASAIRELLDVLRTDDGMSIQVRNRLRHEPPVERRVTLLRISEDALRAAYAARPAQVVVEIDDHNHGVLLSLQHDGAAEVGEDFATAADRARIAVRARLGGGWARFDRRAPIGARASIWIPADATTRNDERASPAMQGSAA